MQGAPRTLLNMLFEGDFSYCLSQCLFVCFPSVHSVCMWARVRVRVGLGSRIAILMTHSFHSTRVLLQLCRFNGWVLNLG